MSKKNIEDFDKVDEISDKEMIKTLKHKVLVLEKLNKDLNDDLKIKYSIFYPKSERGLTADYPELKKIRQFQDVSRLQLLFVWYFACEGSPLINIKNTKERISESIEKSFGKLDSATKEIYLSENFPEKVKLAIAEMKSFKIGPRVVARRMMENILNNWKQITDIDATDNSNFEGKDGVDWTKKKAFVETGATVSKNIGTLIQQVEGSYAVSIKEQEENQSDLENLIESFHDSKE